MRFWRTDGNGINDDDYEFEVVSCYGSLYVRDMDKVRYRFIEKARDNESIIVDMEDGAIMAQFKGTDLVYVDFNCFSVEV